jgi:hypothetical protein
VIGEARIQRRLEVNGTTTFREEMNRVRRAEKDEKVENERGL